MQPPAGPPVLAALNSYPAGTPPPMSNRIVRREVPIGTSTRPVRAIRPASANTLVPGLAGDPVEANHAPPFSMMAGIFANVSTLLISVGCPHNPLSGGYGGLGTGWPRLPSIDAISAVSSPQTYAPAPIRISIRK